MLYKISSPILSLQIVDRRNKTASLQKFSRQVIADMDPEEYIYHDVEILHSVLTEPNSDFLLQPDTEKYINANADCWTDKELLSSYETFKKGKKSGECADVFVEHLQVKELSKGKVFDAVALKDAANIVTVHLLIGTSKRHPDLISMIEGGTYNAVSMGCFLGHNRVLMADGSYKPIKDIQRGDRVISHKGIPQKVRNLQIHADKTNDQIYKIKVEGLPNVICATKEHPFHVLKVQDKCFVTGEPLRIPVTGYDRYEKRSRGGVYQKPEYQTILADPEFEKYEFEWKPASELRVRDLVSFPISNHVIQDADATVDNARLIGYFLAEGSYLKYKGEKTAAEFNFGLNEKGTLVREVVPLLTAKFNWLEPKIQTRPERNICMVRMYGRCVARWFDKYCGEYCDGKRLPESVLYWPVEIQKHIVAAWFNGDGNRRRIYNRNNGKYYDNVSATTCSETLHYQMRFILARMGIYATTTHVSPKMRRDGIHRKDFWTVTLGCGESQKLNDVLCEEKRVDGEYKASPLRQALDYLVMPIKAITTEFNKEQVFNIEVENDNSYIVEGVAVHNCSVEHVLCTICGAKTEDDYACSHLLYNKGASIPAVDGKVRMCAELCFGSDFYDCSWVRFPADSLAVVKERIA